MNPTLPDAQGAEVIENIPIGLRECRVQPSSLDEEKRTVEMVWTTGAKVRRGMFRSFQEELTVDEKSVRLGRLKSGAAPFLDSHNSFDLRDQIGVVEDAWIKDGKGHARVRFADVPSVQETWEKVKQGVIRNVSVGYVVHKFEVEEKNGVEIRRAVDWEPMEISAVALPADPLAMMRSFEERTSPCVVVRSGVPDSTTQQETGDMADAVNKAAAPAAVTDEPEVRSEETKETRSVEPPKQEDPPKTEERKVEQPQEDRGQRLMDLAADLGKRGYPVSPKTLAKAIRESWADNQLRAQALDDAAAKDLETEVRVTSGSYDEETVRAKAITNALLHRSNPAAFQLEEPAREYRGMQLFDMARECAEAAGLRTRGMSREEVARKALIPGYGVRVAAMHSTSDFANILADVTNKSLRQAYDLEMRTFQPFMRRVVASDFKGINRMQLGEAPTLEKVNEHGEYTRGTIVDGKETYQLQKYGRIFALTWETIVNDDLDAFTRLPSLFGSSAARKENDIAWGVILANAAMGDGTALFHANHGNLKASASGAPSVTTVGAARGAMSKQTGADGSSLINVMARYLLVPPSLETTAEQLISNITPQQTSSVVPPSIRSLQVIAEPRLELGVTIDGTTYSGSATAWYLAASPAQIDTVEYAYLEGEDGVTLDTRMGFDIDGMEIKARLVFAAKAIDHRGLYKDVGTA